MKCQLILIKDTPISPWHYTSRLLHMSNYTTIILSKCTLRKQWRLVECHNFILDWIRVVHYMKIKTREYGKCKFWIPLHCNQCSHFYSYWLAALDTTAYLSHDEGAVVNGGVIWWWEWWEWYLRLSGRWWAHLTRTGPRRRWHVVIWNIGTSRQ